jgi:hypothetical protein
VDACSHCGADLPGNAVFCPSCGRRTDAPPDDTVRAFPIDVQNAEPTWFGLEPPLLVLGIGAVLLVLGVVLLATGAFALGVIAIVLAVCLLPSFLAGARRWPNTPFARAGLSTADRVRDEADVAVESISTWSKAGRDLVRLRKDQFQLRRERDAKIRELGVSVYEEDGRADELKAAAKELDERIAANQREQQRSLAGARRVTRKGRAAVVATEVIKPEGSGALASEGEENEGEPVDADHVGLDPEGEDGGEGSAEPGSAPEGDAEQSEAPGGKGKQAE